MNQRYANVLDEYAAAATELLQAPCRYFLAAPSLSRLLVENSVRERRAAMSQEEPIEMIFDHRPGHATAEGYDVYRLALPDATVRLVHVKNTFARLIRKAYARPEIWLVPRADYVRVYKFLRSKRQPANYLHEPPPVLTADNMRRLRENTIDFLLHGTAPLKKYGVPLKRGLVLTGEPGNGKTMACRWLRQQCQEHDLEWNQVTVEEYETARASNLLGSVFELSSPGIILFDDFDLGMRDREKYGATSQHCGMLSQLDGIDQRQGVVYLFTTNVPLERIDPAFLRRGRIDQIIHFRRPGPDLRRRLIEEHWHEDIRRGIDLDAAVAATEGRSFAELAELKKLLVMHFVDCGQWNWPHAMREFDKNRQEQDMVRPIGFARRHAGSESIAPAHDPMSAKYLQ